MIKEVKLDDHIIYGDWDDCTDNQFMIYYYPNGIDCVVFIFSGMDYGGGISNYFESKTNVVEKIVYQKDKSDWEIKEEIKNLNIGE